MGEPTKAHIPKRLRVSAQDAQRIAAILVACSPSTVTAEQVERVCDWVEQTRLRAATLQLLLQGQAAVRLDNGNLVWSRPTAHQAERIRQALEAIERQEESNGRQA